jgi:hypothetical protein
MFEEYMQGRVSHEPRYAVTAQQIFDAYRKPFDPDMHIAFAHATENVIRAVAEEILREEDEDRRIYLMGFFSDFVVFQPMFPLDPTPLIDVAKSLRLASGEEDRQNYIITSYCGFLGKIRHPEVKALGLALMADAEADDHICRLAANMVWGANFVPEDTSALMEYLSDERDQQRWRVVVHALDMGYDLPDEVIERAFALVSQHPRLSLVKKLLEKGKLPDALREECRLDSNMYIRKLVAE